MKNYTIPELFEQFRAVLTADEGDYGVWWLMSDLVGKRPSELVIMPVIVLTEEQQAQLECWCNDLRAGKPLQYVLGWIPFVDAEILVKPPILIPRPETEEWTADLVDEIIASGKKELRILDMCTGSGCIAIALAHALPDAHIIAADINPEACELARENVRKNNCSNVTVLESDLFDAVAEHGPFDMIVSNPPYIPKAAYESLDSSVKAWEDPRALVSGVDGLTLIKKIIVRAPELLKKEKTNLPALVLEVDHTHAAAVVDLLKAAGFTGSVKKDLFGNDRVAFAHIG